MHSLQRDLVVLQRVLSGPGLSTQLVATQRLSPDAPTLCSAPIRNVIGRIGAEDRELETWISGVRRDEQHLRVCVAAHAHVQHVYRRNMLVESSETFAMYS